MDAAAAVSKKVKVVGEGGGRRHSIQVPAPLKICDRRSSSGGATEVQPDQASGRISLGPLAPGTMGCYWSRRGTVAWWDHGGGRDGPEPGRQGTGRRRQSLSESLQAFSRSMSVSLQRAVFGGESPQHHLHGEPSGRDCTEFAGAGDALRSYLNKAVFSQVLSQHFKKPDLKVTRLTVREWTKEEMDQGSSSVLVDILRLHQDSNSPPAKQLEEAGEATSHFFEAVYGVEAHCKGGPAKGGKKSRVDLLVKCLRVGSEEPPAGEVNTAELGQEDLQQPRLPAVDAQARFEARHDYLAYTTVVQDIVQYLGTEKGLERPEDLLCLPVSFQVDLQEPLGPQDGALYPDAAAQGGGGGELTTCRFSYLMLEDLYSMQFRAAEVDCGETGLDFTHTMLVLARMASFHAVSYCLRLEKGLVFLEKYPFLRKDPVYRDGTQEIFQKVQTIMASNLEELLLSQDHDRCEVVHCSMATKNELISGARDMHRVQRELLGQPGQFGVLCHGDLWRQNILFSYEGRPENVTTGAAAGEAGNEGGQVLAAALRFDDLHSVRFASCVTDILYFLFTSVDCLVRKDHTANFLSAYHHSFVKTVRMVAPQLAPAVFSREALSSEFQRLLLHGALEGICLYTVALKAQLKAWGRPDCSLKAFCKQQRMRQRKKVHPMDRTWSGAAFDLDKADVEDQETSGKASAEVELLFGDYRDSVMSIVNDYAVLQRSSRRPRARGSQ